MFAGGTWLLDGVAELEFIGAPSLKWLLSKGHVSGESCFAETRLSQSADHATLEIEIHPKVGDVRLSKLHIRWLIPHLVVPLTTGTRGIALDGTSDPDILWSLREDTAPTQITIEAAGVVRLVSDLADYPLNHSLPGLRLYLGPLSKCPTLSESLQHPFEGHTAILSPHWLEDGQAPLRNLLKNKHWLRLGITTLLLDARLSLNAPQASGLAQQAWSAFAKTCQEVGLLAGVTALPQYWTGRGHGPDSNSPKKSDQQPPNWCGDQAGLWQTALGDQAYWVDFASPQARDMLIQWLLWQYDQGLRVTYFLDMGLAARTDIPLRGRAYRSLMHALAVLQEEVTDKYHLFDKTLTAEQIVGVAHRQSDVQPTPLWRSPLWWSSEIRSMGAAFPRINAQVWQEPKKVVVSRLIANSTKSILPPSRTMLVDIGKPPPKPVTPKQPFATRYPRVSRILFGLPDTISEVETLSTWPPESFWKDLTQALIKSQ